MKKIVLLFVTILITWSCNNGSNINNDNLSGDTSQQNLEIEVSYIPKAITGYSSSEDSREIFDIHVTDWKSFYIVPQIGNNYNSWVENDVLPKVKELSTQKASMTDIEIDGYTLRWESYNNDELQEVFMTSTDFNSWTYIVRTQGGEIRQILFSRENDTKHLLALFYRKNVDDMNDIVEIIESPNRLITKCVRTYGISEESQLFVNFASVTDLQGPSEETTGVLLYKNNSGDITVDSLFQEDELLNTLSPASPAVFDDDHLLIEEGALSGYENYPDKDEVLSSVFDGITNKDVAEVEIDPETFVSTLDYSDYSTTISPFTGWSELDNSNSPSNIEIVGDWGNLFTVPQTYLNFNSIKKQSSYDIEGYLDGSNNMNELTGSDDYSKEVYIPGDFRFQANSDFSKWRYTKSNGAEIRQLVYLKDASISPAVKYYYALFYRVDVDDMNDLVVIKTTEDLLTYGACLRVYDISTIPSYYNTFYMQDLESETGVGISVTDLNSESFTYFNRDGIVTEDTTVSSIGFPSLSNLKGFGNSIPYEGIVDTITIDTNNLSGGLLLSEGF